MASLATLPPTTHPVPTATVAAPSTSPEAAAAVGSATRRRSPAPVRVKLGPVGHRSGAPRTAVTPAPRSARPPAARPMVLTRRGLVLAWAAALAAVGLTGFGLVHAAAPSAPAVASERIVTVLPGQSAWDIATAVNPSVDPRVTLDAVEQLNGLESTGLVRPGEQLRVPVYAPS